MSREPISYEGQKPIRLPSEQELSALRERPLAVLVSDIHLSAYPPLARSEEPDWYEAMRRQLHQLDRLAGQAILIGETGVGVFCAGDIFDRWNPPVELVNFALDELPRMYAVPGQHDLPYHRYEEVRRSAYWTLVEANKVVDVTACDEGRLAPECSVPFRLHAFQWGSEIRRLKDPHDLYMEVALAHAMVWDDTSRPYDGVPDSDHLRRRLKQLRGYDVAVFGDNHRGFICKSTTPKVVNNGTFFRRRTDEVGYQPFVTLLYPDGTCKKKYLNTDEDKILGKDELGEGVEEAADLRGVLEKLRNLKEARSDFRSAVYALMDGEKVSHTLRRMVLEMMGEADE